MSKYQSEVKIINASQYQVWNRISDLGQFQIMKDNMPAETKAAMKAKIAEEGGGKFTVSDFSFTRDTALFKVNGMQMGLGIVDREEPMKCVKFQADQSPVEMTLWIQLLPKSPYETKCRVTVEVDIPFFLKPMVGKKLDGIADQLCEMLTKIPY